MKTFKLQPASKRMGVQSFLQRSLMMMAAIMVALVTFVACDSSDDDKNPVEVESVTINQPAAGVELVAGGSSITLSVTIEPANATNKAVTWSSSDNTIATVSSGGVVTGLKPGTVTITATTKSGNKTADFTLTVKPDASVQPIELKSPITENTTLVDLGLDVDYFYAGNNFLIVENNAVLTIEPGVTIRFAHTGKSGGINIKSGSTITAIGTSSNRIQFIGTNNDKGSWAGIRLESNSDNQFAYCDFINAGNSYHSGTAGIYLYNSKAGFAHCKLTNGIGYGFNLASDAVRTSYFSVFTDNVVEDYEIPMYLTTDNSLKALEPLDMTSDFTKNKNVYIQVSANMEENATINQTTVPYYFAYAGIAYLGMSNFVLTINEGVTIYMGDGKNISCSSGRLMINGTATKKVIFTRLPDSGLYNWGTITFDGPGSVIKHCIFEYGGKNDGILNLNDRSNLTLENVEINGSKWYGVRLFSGFKLSHSNVTLKDNLEGNVRYGNNYYDFLP